MTRRRRQRRQSFDPGRLLAGVLASFGALALVLSFYNPITGASEPAEFSLEALPELQEQAQASKLKAASADTNEPDTVNPSEPSPIPQAQPSPTPKPKAPAKPEAAPLEALPASRVRSVGVNQGRSAPASAETTFTGPLSVSLVALDSASAQSVADRVATQLRATSRDVKITSLDTAGRPDVLLVLDASSSSTQAWYCDPGPAGNATLARFLLAGAPAGSSSDDSPGPGLESAFSCEEVHAGRAQTAAVLLELPQTASASVEATATAIGTAINRYLDDNATALRRARGKASFIWPATGPITSHFGPAHPLGIDIGQWEGSIVAALAGKVVFAGGNACCSYGLYAVIESAGGIHTLYAHFSRLDVRAGQTVRQGQPLGLVGCSGHCEGNHLHFEVFQNGTRINPMLYLP